MSRRWSTPVLLLLITSLCGAVFGAMTTATNFCISPEYFARVTNGGSSQRGRDVSGQGLVEGSLVGFAVGVILAVAAVVSTGGQCTFWPARGALLRCAGIMAASWIVGGECASVFAFSDPERFNTLAFYSAGLAGSELCRFGWVAGSIIGAVGGAMTAATYASISLYFVWRREPRSVAGGFPVISDAK